jgi:hypothetical protein
MILAEVNHIFIGPKNISGQAFEWARALRGIGYKATSYTFESNAYAFPVDRKFSDSEELRKLLNRNSVVLIEYGVSPFGGPAFTDLIADLDFFESKNISFGFISHGSDIRIPSLHIENINRSFHLDLSVEINDSYESNSTRLLGLIRSTQKPHFISTPDLTLFDENAIWLPTVTRNSFLPINRSRHSLPILRVGHFPTDSIIKGTKFIAPILENLQNLGYAYRIKHDGRIPSNDFQSLLKKVNILIDSCGIGFYGVTAAETIASGGIALAGISDFVQGFVSGVDQLGFDLDDLSQIIISLAEDREFLLKKLELQQGFVKKWHSGDKSAEVISKVFSNGGL